MWARKTEGGIEGGCGKGELQGGECDELGGGCGKGKHRKEVVGGKDNWEVDDGWKGKCVGGCGRECGCNNIELWDVKSRTEKNKLEKDVKENVYKDMEKDD